ncbi:hypothetical protein [Aquariibacter albus]|uniref:Phage tail sheath family protein n=1 Tax=Aquariibacter albus TaxID=2759899 RepID=A0A839HMA6_9BURK|nr:hypothetical protein [Aquariibacter albus]MBB1163136.1 hypothetical protein [Aquariibacter albus]
MATLPPRGQTPASSLPQPPCGLATLLGATERAMREAPGDLLRVPTRVRSLVEYEGLFGGPGTPALDVDLHRGPDGRPRATLRPPPGLPLLHATVRLFFAQGGEACDIVSVGPSSAPPTLDDFLQALAALPLPRRECSLLLAPEAMHLDRAAQGRLAGALLAHAAASGLQFVLLDLPGGEAPLDAATLAAGRAVLDSPHGAFGALHGPRLRIPLALPLPEAERRVRVWRGSGPAVGLPALRRTDPAGHAAVLQCLAGARHAVPASALVAGLQARGDRELGVWKALSGLPLPDEVEPVQAFSAAQAEALAADPVGGRAINLVRSVPGRGPRLWGARTLADREPESRYVPVRRLLAELTAALRRRFDLLSRQPRRRGAGATPPLWQQLAEQADLELHGWWDRGALLGAKPAEAYFVRCGPGLTQTEAETRAGRHTLLVGLAVLKPGEFQVLRLVWPDAAA